MSEKLSSEGICDFCGKTQAQRGINRHLNSHLSKEKGKAGTSFLVYVKADIMFLSLWVDGDTTFDELDDFLRAIWLECCGHLSAFRDPKGIYVQAPSQEDDFFDFSDDHEVPMDMRMNRVLAKGKKLNYEYDFGSTTPLNIEVKYEYEIQASSSIILLSRNEPLKIMCDLCGKAPATDICSIHIWEGEGYYCEDCTEIHEEKCEDFAEYAAMPVVNSPRMGVCAYDGGSIDLERDGVYKGK